MPVFESEKKISKPTDIQREFHGVKKIAKYTRVKVTATKKHIQITYAEIIEWHYLDGRVEEEPDLTEVTVRIPKELDEAFKCIEQLRRKK